MIITVTCGECGKKYRVDQDRIPGEAARFRCKACNTTITVRKEVPEPPRPSEPAPEPEVEREEPRREERAPVPEPEARPKRAFLKPLRMGLTLKSMVYLFIPCILIYGVSLYISINEMVHMQDLTIKQSAEMATAQSERLIVNHARSVAKEVELYLEAHPGLKKEEFNTDVDFRRIGVQKVGLTGYSAVYELPDENGVWRTWAHENPKIIGIDMSELKKPMGKAFPGFWKVFTGVKGGKESQGYYTWQDADGEFRDKFMVCTPVEGTRFIVASTTYLDEFTMPVKRLEERAAELGEDARRTNIVVMSIGLIFIAVIILLFSSNITGKIRHISNVADRICVGDLDAEVDIRSKDEIGELGDAIARMRDSIKISIQRLRRRLRP